MLVLVAYGTALETQTATIGEQLERYAAGDKAALVELISLVRQGDQVSRAFRAAVAAWIEAGSPVEARWRRLVAATFVLEEASAAADRAVRSSWLLEDNGNRAQRLEWACGLVRSGAVIGEPERLWFLASFDLLGRADPVFLFGTGKQSESRTQEIHAKGGQALNHISHGLSYFPDDPLFRLIEVEGRTANGVVRSALRLFMDQQVALAELPKLEASARAIRSRWDLQGGSAMKREEEGAILLKADYGRRLIEGRAALLQFSMTYLGRLAPDVKAKLDFDVAVVAWSLVESEETLHHLQLVSRTAKNPNLLYLAQYLLGQFHEFHGRPGDAQQAYRHALEILPRAQSASTSLAALLFLGDKREEAALLLQRSHAGTPVRDPWIDLHNYAHVRSPHALLQIGALLRRGPER